MDRVSLGRQARRPDQPGRLGRAVDDKADPGSRRSHSQAIEGRAVLAFSLAIGYHFIVADHDAPDRSDALELAVRRLLA